MLALEVEFLTGRAVATDRTDRATPEWPLHPGRLFSALVAAAYECFSDGAGNLEASVERALKWLEEQPPPSLSATDADRRQTVPVFVPVNDNTVPDAVPKGGFTSSQLVKGLKVLPERRLRQQRAFPSVTPHSPIIYFIWPDADPGDHRPALEKLAANVTYLGHSSSLVRVALTDDHPAVTHQPDDDGMMILRVPSRGRFKQLVDAYRCQSRPTPGMYCGYARVRFPNAAVFQSVFGDAIVFRRTTGQPLPLRAALKLTSAVRSALISLSQPDVPEVLSGHGLGDQPSRRMHIAVAPLAFIEHFYADGNLLGFAVVLPRSLKQFDNNSDRRAVLRAVGRLHKLWEGSSWAWTVEPLSSSERRESLQFERYYLGPAKCWASVTPIVCDRHPKAKEGESAQCIIAESCVRIGLPPPVRVEVLVASPFRGVPPSGHFLGYPKGDPRGGYRVHAIMEFDEPVCGPIIVGKNRYLGLGLMRPYNPRRRQGGGA